MRAATILWRAFIDSIKSSSSNRRNNQRHRHPLKHHCQDNSKVWMPRYALISWTRKMPRSSPVRIWTHGATATTSKPRTPPKLKMTPPPALLQLLRQLRMHSFNRKCRAKAGHFRNATPKTTTRRKSKIPPVCGWTIPCSVLPFQRQLLQLGMTLHPESFRLQL